MSQPKLMCLQAVDSLALRMTDSSKIYSIVNMSFIYPARLGVVYGDDFIEYGIIHDSP